MGAARKVVYETRAETRQLDHEGTRAGCVQLGRRRGHPWGQFGCAMPYHTLKLGPRGLGTALAPALKVPGSRCVNARACAVARTRTEPTF